MPHPRIPDADFVEMFERLGPTRVAEQLKMTKRRVLSRRESIEAKIGRQIKAPAYNNVNTRHAEAHPHRIDAQVQNGIVLVGGDGHYWPGEASTAHRAFVKFAKELKPRLVVMNGDAFDGARVSRHSPIGWENRPTVIEELEAVQERLGEIETAAPRGTRLIWPLGNHDGRFETRLATVAPEYAHVHGFHLKDHVGPRWEPCWLAVINDDVVVKHRYKGGIHATHNNTMWAGKTIVTNHLHSGKVTPFTDYNGTRYGVDTGCLADPQGPQFVDYTEAGPLNWRSGFAVLTFHKGQLLFPELVTVFDRNHVQFRGQVIRV